MKARRQNGFGIIETILVLVIIGLIGFVAWYVYNSKTDTESIYGDAANTQSVTKYKTSAAPTKDWQTVKSPDGMYSLKMPKDWLSMTCEGSTSTVYIASKSDYLAKCQSDSGGEANFSVRADNSASKMPTKAAGYQNFSTTAVTLNKAKGYKTAITNSKDAALLPNSKFIIYSFYWNSKSYYATYIQLTNMPDESKTFDQIVHTWDF